MFYVFYSCCFALLVCIECLEQRQLTFGSLQFVSCAFTPAWRMNVSRVGVYPEVVAVGVAVEMEPQSVTTNLTHNRDEDGKGYANQNQRPGLGHISHMYS